LDSETWPQAKIQPAGAGLALLFLTYSLWIHVDLSFIAFCARCVKMVVSQWSSTMVERQAELQLGSVSPPSL
jgi:hypothetical protein